MISGFRKASGNEHRHERADLEVFSGLSAPVSLSHT